MKQNNKYKRDVVEVDYVGKIPPQVIELEKAVLGALLIQSDAIYDVIGIIKSESFYRQEHQEIFSAIKLLANVCFPIDLITVSNKLKELGKLDIVGGEVYLSELTDRVATSAHLITHARIVQQKYIQRELIRVSAEIQRKAFDDTEDLQDIVNFSEQEMFKVTDINISKDISCISDLMSRSIRKLEERSMSKNSLSGTPSGFTSIDRVTNGFKDSNLIIVAARPSMGKTAWALNVVRNIAVDFNKPVAFFSLEMSEQEITDRFLISETNIDGSKFKTGKLSDTEWSSVEVVGSKLEKAPIFIDDTAALSIFELRSKVRKLVRNEGIKVVVIDYLQLMSGGGEYRGQREQEVSQISRGLKSLAKEMNIPIIALSQLNRSVESRGGNKRPQLSDLRESGAIEQDADVVIFLHRPEYYGIKQDEEGNSTIGLAEIIISKYRDGHTGIVRLRFNGSVVKFSDYDRDDIVIEEADVKEQRIETNDDIPMNRSFYDKDDEIPF